MQKLFTFVFAMLLTLRLSAQHEPIQPFEQELGVKVKILTLSNGKYQETFANDTLLRIGSVMYNQFTGEVVSIILSDTLYGEYNLRPEVVSRWLSPDPLAAQFPNWSPYNFVENNPIRLVDPTGMAPDDYVYLNTKGEEIGRIKDDKVKQVTIIKDENLQKFDALPYGRESIDDAATMGTTYEMKGVLSLYDKSSKDLADPYQDGQLKIADGATGKPRYDIANEHGGYLQESNGTVSVGETYQGTPFSVSEPRPRKSDEVATVHTHPNTGKKEVVAAATGGRYPWSHKGPSPSVDLSTQEQPKQGYYNMVVDKSNVYFYKGTGSNATVITIPKSKL